MNRTISTEAGIPLLTAEIVAQIIGRLKPGIKQLLEMYGREFLHIIVLDTIDGKTILFDGPAVGKVEDYPKPYRTVATLKAALSARTGLNTGDVMTVGAHLLAGGDVIYQGGVNYRSLVVAASGAQAPVDEAVSLMVAVQLSAWCQVQVQKLQADNVKGGSYVVTVTA